MNLNFSNWLVLESKQEIINLGFPSLIATLFYKKYDKYAYTFAKWYTTYSGIKPEGNWFSSLNWKKHFYTAL